MTLTLRCIHTPHYPLTTITAHFSYPKNPLTHASWEGGGGGGDDADAQVEKPVCHPLNTPPTHPSTHTPPYAYHNHTLMSLCATCYVLCYQVEETVSDLLPTHPFTHLFVSMCYLLCATYYVFQVEEAACDLPFATALVKSPIGMMMDGAAQTGGGSGNGAAGGQSSPLFPPLPSPLSCLSYCIMSLTYHITSYHIVISYHIASQAFLLYRRRYTFICNTSVRGLFKPP